MEHLLMSLKERTRMGVMKQVRAKLLSIVVAGKLLRLSYRQAKRVWRRYRDKGDKGLVHRGRGRVGNRRKAANIRSEYWLDIKSAIRTLGRHWQRSI